MARRKKDTFGESKMLSSRVEKSDYMKFDQLIKYRDGIPSLQAAVNLFVVNYISGNVYFSGSVLVPGEK